MRVKGSSWSLTQVVPTLAPKTGWKLTESLGLLFAIPPMFLQVTGSLGLQRRGKRRKFGFRWPCVSTGQNGAIFCAICGHFWLAGVPFVVAGSPGFLGGMVGRQSMRQIWMQVLLPHAVILHSVTRQCLQNEEASMFARTNSQTCNGRCQ